MAFAAGAELGEGARWRRDTGAVQWVDITRGEIHVLEVETGHYSVVRVDEVVGAAVPRRNGDGWVVGLRDGVAVLDGAGRVVDRVAIDAERPTHRMNDGLCDTAGRLWIGTLDEAGGGFADAVFRISPDLTVSLAVEGVGLSNGIGWSPDDSTMYRVDSARGAVYSCDFDVAGGTRGHEEIFTTVDPADGEPDGLTVDSEGFVWVAVWDGWHVRRYRPDGSLDFVLEMPVARPTSCVFGGADMKTLFVTTASVGLSAASRASQPWAGHVLACRTAVRGLPTNAFAG